MKDIQKVIGRNLRYYRYLTNKSQDKYYSEFHLNPKYLSSIERGEVNISVGFLNDISEILNIPMEELIKDDLSRTICKKRVDQKNEVQ